MVGREQAMPAMGIFGMGIGRFLYEQGKGLWSWTSDTTLRPDGLLARIICQEASRE